MKRDADAVISHLDIYIKIFVISGEIGEKHTIKG